MRTISNSVFVGQDQQQGLVGLPQEVGHLLAIVVERERAVEVERCAAGIDEADVAGLVDLTPIQQGAQHHLPRHPVVDRALLDDEGGNAHLAVLRRGLGVHQEEIGDRADAIARAIASLSAGDVLVIAGKGHEKGQIVGAETFPFDDIEVAGRLVMELGGEVAA